MLFRSLRLRLILWYFAILALIVVALSVAIYFTLRHTLYDSLDDSLRTRASLVAASLEYNAAGQPAIDLSTRTNDPNLDDSFQRIFDANGGLIFDNSNVFGAVAADPASLTSAASSGEQLVVQGAGEHRARVLTRPIRVNDQIVGYLQVGQATSDLNDTLNRLLLILLVGGAAALVVASFGGWWLASRALAPIDHVTRMARDITGHDLSRRLNLSLPDDEVGRLARTFDEMIARLDAMFRQQRQFTADASHELRTPLTVIRGEIDVALQRPRDPAEYQRVLIAVNQQVERLTRLVGGLLMLARSDAGALPLERRPVAVGELARLVAEQVEPLARTKGLEIKLDESDPATVVADEDLLLQLMLNLADNAVKYTERGSVSVGWRGNQDAVDLFVRDTGPGVPAEHRARIFERFHRIERGRNGQGEGVGLGLAISRWIAEAHGGSIRLDATPDGGSTFTATIPR